MGTIVGGIAIKGKSAKKISGLRNPTSRIAAQMPIQGAYNVRFQVGGVSVAGVLFVAEDPEVTVLAKLRESLQTNRLLVSPRAPERLRR